MQNKKCAIYTRVSTDNQAEKEYNSCTSQEEKIRAYISSQNDWQTYNIFSDEGFSGANINRPAFQRLLNDLDKIDVILFYKLDRLTRSPKDFYRLVELFEKHNVDFISITEHYDTSTPSGRLLMNIMLTFAQFERELSSERTKDKMIQRAENGFWNGGTVPYGYISIENKLKLEPSESDIVEKIFSLLLEKKHLIPVYDYLKSNNIKNKRGKSFSLSTLSYLVRNPIYTGQIKYNGELYKGIHRKIIKKETFKSVNDLLSNRPKRYYQDKVLPFEGLLRCSHCDKSMTPTYASKQRKKNKTKYYYYRCITTLKHKWGDCPIKQVSARKFDTYVFQYLKRLVDDKKILTGFVFSDVMKNQSARHSGFEISENFLETEVNLIHKALKSIVKTQKESSSQVRNSLLKKCIKKINYSPHQIEIELSLSEPTDDKRAGEEGGRPRAGARDLATSSCSRPEKFKDIPVNKNSSFFENYGEMAAHEGFELSKAILFA
ncbi:recombinase family protein [Elusimicrobiota bacterium]